ncbi:unnamed protein product [Mytilus edulis]|uniref:Uncharacterized protein n=1 Tax=Mytilus edulis TaxID=6550 RepID=A0A8S3SZM2_MYTED|nr:unnamed protein product [Mytilus edulis]
MAVRRSFVIYLGQVLITVLILLRGVSGDCTNCKPGQCDSSQTCGECEDGWYGNPCFKRCGSQCPTIQTSTGIFSKVCDKDTGKCTGGCRNDVYGEYCDKQCSSHCLQLTGRICDLVSGKCLHSCTQGYYGEDCTSACSKGCYPILVRGAGFVNKCSPQTGICESDKDCKPGWCGTKCDLSCGTNCKTTHSEFFGKM